MSKCQQNPSLKMCVLSALTNNGTVSMRLIAIDRAIHNRGPKTLKFVLIYTVGRCTE